MTNECWKPVVDPTYTELYEVSNAGLVRQRKTGNLITIIQVSSGSSPVVRLRNGATYTSRRVSYLVWEAFHGPIQGRQLQFLDGNVANMTLENLQIKPEVDTGNRGTKAMQTVNGEVKSLKDFYDHFFAHECPTAMRLIQRLKEPQPDYDVMLCTVGEAIGGLQWEETL